MEEELNQLISFCKSHKYVICYGAGFIGKDVKTFLESNLIQVNAFVVSDNSQKKQNEVLKVPIYGLNQLPMDKKECAWIICAGNLYHKEIITNLAQYNIHKAFIITSALNRQMRKKCFEDVIQINKKLKNTANSNRCFILCTGPSVKSQNIINLKNEVVFCVSSGYLLKEYNDIVPKYHCSPSLENCNWNEDVIIETFKTMEEKVKSKILFLDINDKKYIDKYNLLKNHNKYYLWQESKWDVQRKSIYSLAKKSPEIQTAPIMILKIAMYMGFKEIYLLGTEHDFFLTGEYKHAVEYKTDSILDKICRENEKSVRNNKYRIILRQATNVFEEYHWLHCIANKNNIKIFNATKGGVLDEFERVDFDDIFR